MNVFIVTLRRPKTKEDPRTDPFWEFGSFGCTGCHAPNLLHPTRCKIQDGDRLAFVQGGHHGPRLLLVTPPVTRVDHTGTPCVELRWDPAHKPFRYSDTAPRLFGSDHPGELVRFPRFEASIEDTQRSTPDAKFASRFRARATALDAPLAAEIVIGFELAVKSAKPTDFIANYADALPWLDTVTSLGERRREYRRRLRELGTVNERRSCPPVLKADSVRANTLPCKSRARH